MNKLTKDNYPKESLDHNIQSAKERIKFIIEQYNKNINLDFINSRKGYFRALFAGLLGYPVRTPYGITELAFDFDLNEANHDAFNKFYTIIGGNRRIFRYLEKFIKVSLKDEKKKNWADLNCYYAFRTLGTEIDKPKLNKEYIKTLIGVIFGYKVLFLGDEITGFVSFCGNPADYKLAPFIKAKKVEEVAPSPAPTIEPSEKPSIERNPYFAGKPSLSPILYTLDELQFGECLEITENNDKGVSMRKGDVIMAIYGTGGYEMGLVKLNDPNALWSGVSRTWGWLKDIQGVKVKCKFEKI